MGLPNPPVGESEVKVLSNSPLNGVDANEVEADHVGFELGDLCRDGGEHSFTVWHDVIVDQSGSNEPGGAIDQPKKEGRDHEAFEIFPVGPASTDVYHGKDVVRFTEEFVAESTSSVGCAETPQENQENHGDDAPDHVFLLDPSNGDGRLGLIQLDLDNAPSDRMQQRLSKDDMADPSMEKVEVVVRYSRTEREQ